MPGMAKFKVSDSFWASFGDGDCAGFISWRLFAEKGLGDGGIKVFYFLVPFWFYLFYELISYIDWMIERGQSEWITLENPGCMYIKRD